VSSKAETIAAEVRTWLNSLVTTTTVTVQTLAVAPPPRPTRQSLAATKVAYVHPWSQTLTIVNRARDRHRTHVVMIYTAWGGSGESPPDWSAALTWIEEVCDAAATQAWTSASISEIAIGEDGILGSRSAYYERNQFESAILLTFAAPS
jgi:hypothetical protein